MILKKHPAFAGRKSQLNETKTGEETDGKTERGMARPNKKALVRAKFGSDLQIILPFHEDV